MDAAAAEARLPEVAAVLRAPDGAVAGACSVFAADFPLIANRRLYVFRSLLPGAARERFFDLFAAVYAALDASYDGADGEPIGLCALLDEPERRARPEAVWTQPRTLYLGYLADGRQVRVAYFSAAESVGNLDWASETGYRVVAFDEQDEATPDDVVALWTSEGVLPEDEARRRVDEVMLVAIADDGRVVGVSTRYLERNEQLRMDLWYVRGFVAASHRRTAIGTALAVRGIEWLEQRFVSGRDTRAQGVIYEVEHEPLKRYYPNALWRPPGVYFIGENARGDHVRVHYFAGAMAA